MAGGCLGARELCGFLIAVTFLPSSRCVPSNHIVSTFVDPTEHDVANNHLVIHQDSGILYVGSVNRIYQLDPNLGLLAFNKTGPHEDSPECSGYQECPVNAKVSRTNNVNKALVVDYTRGKLIACGSLFQGLCWTLGLDNVSISTSHGFSGEPVVANDESASTVAFIAPGPPSPPNTTVLYVGVTYTGNSPYRHEVPAVSSRSLNHRDNFQVTVGSTSPSGSKMHVSQRDSYPVNYVYGFSSEGFSYFLTTQRKDVPPNSPHISKLVRVCQNDDYYYSYTEIPIECISEITGSNFDLVQAAFLGKAGPDLAGTLGTVTNDDVLFAAFSRSDPRNSSLAGKKSALCVYSLKDIRRKFTENIELCFKGKGNRGLRFTSMNAPCASTKLVIEEDFCGIDVNTPLGGDRPVQAVSVLNFSTQLTSVAATITGDYTVAFLGTREGHLKKVVVKSERSGSEYADQDIDSGSRVLPDMFLDFQKSHIYVMTERKISKVLVHNCFEFETCMECTGDPFCGWCSLQNKCTLKSDCAKNSKSELSLNLISYKSGQCARITSVTPPQLPSVTVGLLTINIDNLPTRSGEFWCVFRFPNSKRITTNANLTTNGALCYTPPTVDLLHIFPQQNNHTATLSVTVFQKDSSKSSSLDLVSTDFTFFDCNTYTSCTTCVASAFPCTWCVDKHRCTHDTAEDCRHDVLVTGVNRIGPSIRIGPGFCPRINVTNGSPAFRVPNGTLRRIQVKVDNIAQQMVVQPKFSCRFNIEGAVITSSSQLVENVIYCDSTTFSYNSTAPNITVPFSVTWGVGEGKSLDNPDNIHIFVYRCSELADNCGMCLTMDEGYLCGWCQSSNQCQIREQCDNGLGVWLNRNQTCPNPEIRSFNPTSGPWEVGTNVTIEGVNLGKTVNDIEVTVAGVPCKPHRHLYMKTRKIVCLLEGIASNEPKEGTILVKVSDFRAESTTKYKFVDPLIVSISPTVGPMNGGTRLTIYGEHLNTGSDIQAFVGNRSCQIILKEPNYITCRTGSFPQKGTRRVIVKYGEGERIYEPGFSYVDNPIILFKRENPIRSIPAGGLDVTITGENFDVVQEAFMYVTFNGSTFTSPCRVSRTLLCVTPVFQEEPIFGGRDSSMRLPYGFILDTVRYTAANSTNEDHPFLLFPDPQYDRFEEEIRYYHDLDDYLILNGQNLNAAANESDVAVLIGKGICEVTSLTKNQLTCKPPPTQPPDMNELGRVDSSRSPTVRVKVGKNLTYVLGRLRYSYPGEHTTTMIYMGSSGGFILVVILIIILMAYRRKSTESSRVIPVQKSMGEQMDVLELRSKPKTT